MDITNTIVAIRTYGRWMVASVRKVTARDISLGHIWFADTGASTYGNYSIPLAGLSIAKPTEKDVDGWVRSYRWFHTGEFANDAVEDVEALIENTEIQ